MGAYDFTKRFRQRDKRDHICMLCGKVETFDSKSLSPHVCGDCRKNARIGAEVREKIEAERSRLNVAIPSDSQSIEFCECQHFLNGDIPGMHGDKIVMDLKNILYRLFAVISRERLGDNSEGRYVCSCGPTDIFSMLNIEFDTLRCLVDAVEKSIKFAWKLGFLRGSNVLGRLASGNLSSGEYDEKLEDFANWDNDNVPTYHL